MSGTLPTGSDIEPGHTGPMGFNPHRQYRRTTADYVMVAAAVVACLALLAWAAFG